MDYSDLTVIITTRDEERHIENCLKSIKKQSYPQDQIEIIVVDNNSKDKTKEIAYRYTDKVYNFGPERSQQRNFGAGQANGKYILYLDADMELSENLIKECVYKCENDGYVALYIPERIVGRGFWIRVRDFERSFYNSTCIDCVRFVRRDKFLEIGGFDKDLTGPEDWDFDRRIRQLGKTGIVESPIYHNEQGFGLRRYLKKKKYYSNWLDKYIQKWGRDDPIVRKQLGFWYRYVGVFFEQGKWLRIIRHPLLGAGVYFLRGIVGLSYLLRTHREDKKGILIISPFFRPNIGGVENYLHDLCEYLRTHGYMVYVLTYTPLTVRAKAENFEKTENMEVRRVPWIGYNLFHKLEPYPALEFLYLTPWLFIHAFLFMLKKSDDIDVIHAQGLNAAFITRILAFVFNKRAVMSTCAVYNFQEGSLFSRLVKNTLAGMDMVLPLGDFSKRELVRIGLQESKLITYHLWVDQTKYSPSDKKEAKKRLSLEDEFLVLFVGRFIKIKGVEAVLEAAKMVNEKIQFIFIGDEGPLLKRIENESRHRKNIILVRGISGLQLVPYYQAADIVVVPSQYDEAFGKVIIESLSCGTAVIGSNRGAIPDIVSTLVGRVVEPTPDNIAREIEYFYNHSDILAALTRNCRPYAQEHFGEQNIKAITDSYN